MRCVIPGRCIKVFGKAVHCLSKIGDELYLEALSQGLALRTVNSSRSAYACFVFSSSFFQSYDDGSDESQDGDMQKCKIAMKSCLSVFKSLSTLEKSVDRCNMELDIKECRLVFMLYCRHGITKTYNLTFQECETLQAVFTKDLCPNRIITPCRVLADTVLNFPINQEEITMIVSPETLKIKNYLEDEPDPSKVIHTEMTLVPEEFDSYQIGLDTEVTFCLKELRAILSFAESVNQPINMFFETGGRPIVFCFTGDSTFESDFVLATLVEPSTSSQASQATASQASNINRKIKKTKSSQNEESPAVKRPRKQREEKSSEQELNSQSLSRKAQPQHNGGSQYDEVKVEEVEDWMMDDLEDILVTPPKHIPEQTQSSSSRISKEANSTRAKDNDNFFSDSFPYKDLFVQSKKKPTKEEKKEESQENSEQSFYSINPIQTPASTSKDVSHIRSENMPSLGDSCPSPQHPPVLDQRPGDISWNQGGADTSVLDDVDENDMDCVPGTPPSKKFKSMFFNAPALSQTNKEGPSEVMVLAEDTDDESD